MKRFELRTSRREELVDITGKVAAAIAEAGVRDGIANVFCPHTTAGITINENADADVVADLIEGLQRVSPQDAGWRHREGNSDGHLKSSLVGPSLVVPVESGRLALGVWQGIYFCEFDGPRSRSFFVTLIEGR